MRDAVLKEGLAPAKSTRLDVMVFFGAFTSGLVAYSVLRGLEVHQGFQTAAVVFVLSTDAVVVAVVPRLRVRLDQAGDNAYYLGLLFTLMSMAVALYDFGAIALDRPGASSGRSGAETIIGNFGIALASTIAGIFIRVVLHQMRVDPADVESMTRIELAEAAKRVKATLDTVTLDMGRFHEEVRQRTEDVATTVLADLKRLLGDFSTDVASSARGLMDATGDAQQRLVERSTGITLRLEEAAEGARQAIERLRAVEPPPLKLAGRLEKVSESLDLLANRAERLIVSFKATDEASSRVVSSISTTASTIASMSQENRDEQAAGLRRIAQAAEEFRSALGDAGETLKANLERVRELGEESRLSADAALETQRAASEVIATFTDAARELTAAVKDAAGEEHN
jgi:hypothetical protein